MAQIFKEIVVNYTKEQAFALVNDIEAYPKFVPNCTKAQLLTVHDEYVIARLELEKAGIKHSFTTKNFLFHPNKIELTLVEGPFKVLQGAWEFIELDEHSTKITLKLDMVLQNMLLELAFASVLEAILANMLLAFVQRAEEVYGNNA